MFESIPLVVSKTVFVKCVTRVHVSEPYTVFPGIKISLSKSTFLSPSAYGFRYNRVPK